MIVRSARPAGHFTVVQNQVIRDSRLSWKARGLLIYLLSMPDNWRTSSTNLAAVGPDGREAVRTGLAELAAAGYLRRQRRQAADGTWSTVTYVFDTAQGPVETGADSPQPTCEKPTPVNRTLKEGPKKKDVHRQFARVTQVGNSRLCTGCQGAGVVVTGSSTVGTCTSCRGDGLAH